MKKLVAIVFVVLIMTMSTSALANSTVSESFTGRLYHHFPDGTTQITYQVVAVANHSYLLKNNTAGLYNGATNQGTKCQRGARATYATVLTQPDFTATVSDGGRKIVVTFSRGSVEVNYRDWIDIDELGNQTLTDWSTTLKTQFYASQEHTK